MESKQVSITCPCCESRLDVDVRTRKILRWSRKEELDDSGKHVVREGDWDVANERVEGRMGDALDKFDAHLTREKNREKDLDDLFKKANQKLSQDDDEA